MYIFYYDTLPQSTYIKTVILFPDLNAYDKWNAKANELSTLCNIMVSDLLERQATETDKQQGLDLADYLVAHKK